METTGKKIVSIDNSSNVILMDYSEISDCNYIYLATKVVNELSKSLAESIKQWKLDLDRTRIIGFSVGAHIGKFIFSKSTLKRSFLLSLCTHFILEIVAGITGTILKTSTDQQLAQIDGKVFPIHFWFNNIHCAPFFSS